MGYEPKWGPYGRFTVEEVKATGCPAECDECEEYEPGYMALRAEHDGHTFEVARINGGQVAEDAMRVLLSRTTEDGEQHD